MRYFRPFSLNWYNLVQGETHKSGTSYKSLFVSPIYDETRGCNLFDAKTRKIDSLSFLEHLLIIRLRTFLVLVTRYICVSVLLN